MAPEVAELERIGQPRRNTKNGKWPRGRITKRIPIELVCGGYWKRRQGKRKTSASLARRAIPPGARDYILYNSISKGQMGRMDPGSDAALCVPVAEGYSVHTRYVTWRRPLGNRGRQGHINCSRIGHFGPLWSCVCMGSCKTGHTIK